MPYHLTLQAIEPWSSLHQAVFVICLGAVILLGKTNMFRFNHPGEAAKLRQKYASVDNLASVVPTKELEKPSYLFYNAG